MTKADLYSISLKILGLISIYRFVIYLKEFIIMLIANNNILQTSAGDLNVSIYTTFSFGAALELIIGLLLILKTDKIVSWISKDDIKQDAGFPYKRIDFIEAGLAIFSIVLITYSLTELLSFFVESTYFHDHKESVYFTGPMKRSVFYLVFKLVAGIFLIMNARYFASLIVKHGDLNDAKKE